MQIETHELAALLSGSLQAKNQQPRELGQQIVVLDRGFVYVGTITEEHDRITIRNAKNIRVWGTTNGLGELRDGPTSSTKLDPVGDVVAYRPSVIHLIACKGF